MNQVLQSLGLADMQLTHIALAVRDLDAATQRFAMLGFSFAPPVGVAIPTRYKGEETVAGLRFAFASAGPVRLELVEATGGNSTVATFVSEHGEGVQHMGYVVDSVEDVVGRAKELGVDVDWQIEDKHGLAVAFVGGDVMAGMSAEIIRRDPPLDISEWVQR